jgi:hypothetical protein
VTDRVFSGLVSSLAWETTLRRLAPVHLVLAFLLCSSNSHGGEDFKITWAKKTRTLEQIEDQFGSDVRTVIEARGDFCHEFGYQVVVQELADGEPPAILVVDGDSKPPKKLMKLLQQVVGYVDDFAPIPVARENIPDDEVVLESLPIWILVVKRRKDVPDRETATREYAKHYVRFLSDIDALDVSTSLTGVIAPEVLAAVVMEDLPRDNYLPDNFFVNRLAQLLVHRRYAGRIPDCWVQGVGWVAEAEHVSGPIRCVPAKSFLSLGAEEPKGWEVTLEGVYKTRKDQPFSLGRFADLDRADYDKLKAAMAWRTTLYLIESHPKEFGQALVAWRDEDNLTPARQEALLLAQVPRSEKFLERVLTKFK